jgi:hypothetical protein
MNIDVRIDKNYGKKVYYPVCEQAKRFAEIAGTVTITEYAMKVIKGLGVTITVIPETLNILA